MWFLQQEWKFEVELTKINCLWGLWFLFGAFVKCTYCMIVCSDIWASIVWSMSMSTTSICSKAWFIGPWFFWFKTDNNYMLHKTEIIFRHNFLCALLRLLVHACNTKNCVSLTTVFRNCTVCCEPYALCYLHKLLTKYIFGNRWTFYKTSFSNLL